MSNEKDERSISKDTAENIRSGGTALSLTSATLDILDKCGAVCKKIPIGSDIVDSVLVYDETKSVRKALVRFGVNTIGGLVDKPLVVIFIFDVELGVWTYKVINNAKSFVEDKTNSFIDNIENFFEDMFNTINNSFRGWQNRLIFEKTGVWFEAYLEKDKLEKIEFAGSTEEIQGQYLEYIKHNQKNLTLKPQLNLKPTTEELDNHFNLYFAKVKSILENDIVNNKAIPIALFNKQNNRYFSQAFYIQKLNPNDIDSLTKDSPIHLLNALYQCEDYILLDENKEAIVNKKSFNYKSSFYLSFLSNQDSISNEYLEARKSLYKSISQLKQEKQKQELQELQKQQ
ncbi:hypothetical protein LS65_009575, partial [Helicobacter japonicus]